MIYLSGKVRAGVPAMLTPHIRRVPAGVWAADNGCFSRPEAYSDAWYLAWLERRAPYRETCLFATAPDVWGDGPATIALSTPVLPAIRELGYRTALVAQPGTTIELVPWDLIDALFVGGPNEWQHSEPLIELVAEARARGKWVHMGRVNTRRRLAYAVSIGCSSSDGTILAFDPERPIVEWADEIGRQTAAFA